MKLYERAAIGAVFVAQLAALTIAASRNLHQFNPDAVAYLQVARHLLRGELALSVNGYWGPLISWLAVPLLALTHDPFVTARGVMIVSALVFSFGAFLYLRRSKLPFAAVWIATAACAFVTVYWSVSDITPDLLADGLLFAGFGALSEAEWTRARPLQRWSGLFFGAAYLAKAVMLPIAVATILAISIHHWLRHRHAPREVARAAIRTLAFLAILALPWIVVLSMHYRRPTFSTAGPIAHSLVGPPDADRRNPIILSFRHPRPGRLVDSEDPNASAFHDWSPFASRDYTNWQLTTIRRNGAIIRKSVDDLTSVHVGVIVLLLALLMAIVFPRRADHAPSLLAIVPLLAAAAIYAPVFADSVRYYILAYPLMLGAAAAIPMAILYRSDLAAILATAIVAAAIVIPARQPFETALRGMPNRAQFAAIDLAQRMQQRGMTGPIAGVAPIDGGMSGLYTAFLLEVPWCGDEPRPRIETLRASGARYWLIGTDDRQKLQSIPPGATRDVTAAIYGTGAVSTPFIVREVIR